MSDGGIRVTGVRATTLTPHHYHSLAVQSGTATQPDFLSDRAMAFAVASAVGALAAHPALPRKDYRRHMSRLPCLASLFETHAPRLMRPSGRRLNLDAEGGWSLKDHSATSTGNLKTWFFVQEVPPGVVYEGAYFGADPFALAESVLGKPVDELVVRTGRHLSGLVKLERHEVASVRMNAHTWETFGRSFDEERMPDGRPLTMEKYVTHDIQATERLSPDHARLIVERWLAGVEGDLAA